MKKYYNKKLDINSFEPETPLESIESLEEFLIADFGQKDWSPTFLRNHFKICKDEIEKIEGKRLKKLKNIGLKIDELCHIHSIDEKNFNQKLKELK